MSTPRKPWPFPDLEPMQRKQVHAAVQAILARERLAQAQRVLASVQAYTRSKPQ